MLGIVVTGAISIQYAIQNMDANIRVNMPTIVSVEFDIMAAYEYAELNDGLWPETTRHLPAELLAEIGALPQVRDYELSASTSLVSAELKRYHSIPEMAAIDDGMGDWLSFHVRGVYSSYMPDIEENVIELTAGRTFTNEEVSNLVHVALISSNFATVNNLHVGSTFSLDFIGWNTRGMGSFEPSFFTKKNVYLQQSYTFQVVGIFESHAMVDTGDKWLDADILDSIENRIYVPNPVAMAVQVSHIEHEREMRPDDEWFQRSLEDIMWLQNIYALSDPLEMRSFSEAVGDIVPPFWYVSTSSNPFSDVAASMENLDTLATVVLWAALGMTISILSLVFTFLVRNRKREIGIYLALGEKKSRIIAQMVVETSIAVPLAIITAFFVGSILSAEISEMMLRNSLLAAQRTNGGTYLSTLDKMGFSNSISADEVLLSYSVALSVDTAVTIFAVSIGTVLAATIVPTLYILRLNPKTIMM